jgi:hypothetical protein
LEQITETGKLSFTDLFQVMRLQVIKH